MDKKTWILASILYNMELRPDHIGAIRELLGYPTQEELYKYLFYGDDTENRYE
jgi:hypothetical protein